MMEEAGHFGLPGSLIIFRQLKLQNLDKYGCVETLNEVAQEFNRQLKQRVTQLRKLLPEAALTYVNVYSAKYALISEAKKQGKRWTTGRTQKSDWIWWQLLTSTR